MVFGSGLLDKLVAKQQMKVGKAVTLLAGVKLESLFALVECHGL